MSIVVPRLCNYMKAPCGWRARSGRSLSSRRAWVALISELPLATATRWTRVVQHRGAFGPRSLSPLVNGGRVRLTKDAYERVSALKGQRLNHLTAQLGAFPRWRQGGREETRRFARLRNLWLRARL